MDEEILDGTNVVALTLPYPISANRYWATHVMKGSGGKPARAITYVTNEAKAYRIKVGWEAMRAGIRQPLKGRVCVSCYLYPSRPMDWARRQRKDPEFWEDSIRCIDLGNCEKIMSDALQGTVIENDKSIWRLALNRMECDEDGARLVVYVRPYKS